VQQSAAAAAAAGRLLQRREKENIKDFIERKREMFLIQMSLDTKREEIRKMVTILVSRPCVFPALMYTPPPSVTSHSA
jgi:hypothetical protein